MNMKTSTVVDKILIDNKLENFTKKYVNMEHYHIADIIESSHFTYFLIKLLVNFENIVFITSRKFIAYDFLFSKIFNNFNTRNLKDLCISKLSNKNIEIKNDSFRNHIFYDLDSEKLLIFIRITVDKKESSNIEELVKKTRKTNSEIKNMLSKVSKYKVENLVKKCDRDFIIKELDDVIHLTLSFGIPIDFENFTKILKLDKLFAKDEVENICFGGLIFIVDNKIIKFNELLDFFRKVINISEEEIEFKDNHILIYLTNSIKVEIVDKIDGVEITYKFHSIKKSNKTATEIFNIPVITEKQLELLQKSMYSHLKNVLNRSNKETSLRKLLKIVRRIEKEARMIDFLIS